MSRSRNIKPGFFKNELLVGIPFEFRLLFVGLWTVADREGRFEDKPMRIRMELFPADNVDVDAGLSALAFYGFISRYTDGVAKYCQVITWAKHQNPHFREKASVIPSEESLRLLNEGISGKPEALPGLVSVKPETGPEQARLIPDSLIPDSKALEQQAARSTAKRATRFEDFWATYPKKKGRADALKTWTAKNYDSIADTIVADVKQRKVQDREWLDGFSPHGSTYLNGKGWEDDIPPARECSGSGMQPPDHMLGAL